MIKHILGNPQRPTRVIILGASGFIGLALAQFLQQNNIQVIPLSSKQVDLTDPQNAVPQLIELLQPSDVVVFLSVIGPNRGHDTQALIKNQIMAETVSFALQQKPCAQLIYASSEAVYSMSDEYISSSTKPSPSSLYGIMHLAREVILQNLLANSTPLMIARITQVYGPGCTHNAYGPCRFVRLAHQEQKIELFGQGEEQRDFIFIDDVIQLLYLLIINCSQGITNIATGKCITYLELSQRVKQHFAEDSIQVISKPRAVPITHRHFIVDDLLHAFPEFKFTSLELGIDAILSKELNYAE